MRPDWRQQLLKAIKAPVTQSNLAYLNAWNRAEGNSFANNPFNTTLQTGNQIGPANEHGVRAYSSPRAGINATARTLRETPYAGIVKALRKGTDPYAAVTALGSSPWGSDAGLVREIIPEELPLARLPRPRVPPSTPSLPPITPTQLLGLPR
jgi:hypothetical protein